MKKWFELKFVRLSRKFIYISAFYLTLFFIALMFKGLNLGMDFTGGILVEVKSSATAEEIREKLTKSLGVEVRVVQAEDIFVIKAKSLASNITNITDIIVQTLPDAEIIKTEIVGASVGQDLKEKGVIAFFLSLLAIMIYISFRFQYKFAIGAILALLHDIVFALGFFSLLGYEFNINELLALLTVMGYSVNDTIIIFDRIRENITKTVSENINLELIVDKSIAQTLSRSLMTSFVTLLTVISLMVYGGESLFGFSLVLFIGIIVGASSSIFIASWFLIVSKLSRCDIIPKDENE